MTAGQAGQAGLAGHYHYLPVAGYQWCTEDHASRIDVERLGRAISDHGDICSRMAIPECAEAIAREYAALSRAEG